MSFNNYIQYCKYTDVPRSKKDSFQFVIFPICRRATIPGIRLVFFSIFPAVHAHVRSQPISVCRARLIAMFQSNSITRRFSVCDVERVVFASIRTSKWKFQCEDVEIAVGSTRTTRHLEGLALCSRLFALRCFLRAASSRRLRGTNEETLPLIRGITMRRRTGHGKLNIRSRKKKVIVSEYIFHGARRGTHSCLRYENATRDLIILHHASEARFICNQVLRSFLSSSSRENCVMSCDDAAILGISKMTVNNQIFT